MSGIEQPSDENLTLPQFPQGENQRRVSSNAASAGGNTRDSSLPHSPQVLDWV